MKERPILFNGDMVRAILDGSKTQTRRVMKPQPSPLPPDDKRGGHWWPSNQHQFMLHVEREMQVWAGLAGSACPHGGKSDQLWVRETWRGWVCINPPSESRKLGVARYVPAQMECRRLDYKATQAADNEPYRPSIHMPRWASRIQLEIVSVRVERLNDISNEDAAAEGFGYPAVDGQGWKLSAKHNFKFTWDKIYQNWDKNPWVWVIEFKRV